MPTITTNDGVRQNHTDEGDGARLDGRHTILAYYDLFGSDRLRAAILEFLK
jgi:hypothetical protein